MTCRHAGAKPVYAPNSYGGPQADPAKAQPSWWVEAGEMGRYEYTKHSDDNDFAQAGALYRDVMDDTDREHLAHNIVAHAGDGVSPEVRERVVQYWTNVDAGLGAHVAAGLAVTDGAGADAAGATEAARTPGAPRDAR
jgi:catalase